MMSVEKAFGLLKNSRALNPSKSILPSSEVSASEFAQNERKYARAICTGPQATCHSNDWINPQKNHETAR